MLGLTVLVALVFVSADAATTVTMPPMTSDMDTTTTTMMMTTVAPKILYDFKHHKAMIVRADGCYEYHLNHQDLLDAENMATRPMLEARMLDELSRAINVQETGHHHIDHMTQEITTACASVPVYSWETA